MSATTQLPIPDSFVPQTVGEVWRVAYQQQALAAKNWARQHQLRPATEDSFRVCLLAIDVQNTFCIPDFELFVGGRSGMGAVEDNIRLCQFIYRHLPQITEIALTMDTHKAAQIFHPIFWVNDAGEHPAPMTLITLADVEQGVWQANPAIAPGISQPGISQPGISQPGINQPGISQPGINQTGIGSSADRLQSYALHYVRKLNQDGKYPLTIWPYHSMLGGIGHAIVAAVETACFFHNIARDSQTHFELKGNNPLTENYSVLSPEVLEDQQHHSIAQKNTAFLQKLLNFNAILIAGQAKSHCVAWTIDDLLTEIQATDPALAQKVYLLEDCTSPVVVPGVVDFTDAADAAYQRFAQAGMHVVQSTQPIENWLKR